jgi:hypothetical protein
MIKLKNILSEAYAWERQEGKPLPTMAEVKAAYQAKLREDAHNEDPDEKNHEYEEPPIDDDDDDDGYVYEAEDKADKDYDGDGEVESGSEEYLGSRDKAIKAAADSTPHGNNIGLRRAIAQLKNNKDGSHIYGHKADGTVTKLNSPSDADNAKYKKFTIKQGENGPAKDGPIGYDDATDSYISSKNVKESLNSRILKNLRGSEYILSETFKK